MAPSASRSPQDGPQAPGKTVIKLSLPPAVVTRESRLRMVEVTANPRDGSIDFASSRPVSEFDDAGIPGLVNPEILALETYSRGGKLLPGVTAAESAFTPEYVSLPGQLEPLEPLPEPDLRVKLRASAGGDEEPAFPRAVGEKANRPANRQKIQLPALTLESAPPAKTEAPVRPTAPVGPAATGGGHKQAAGASSNLSYEQTKQSVLQAIEKAFKLSGL